MKFLGGEILPERETFSRKSTLDEILGGEILPQRETFSRKSTLD